MKLAEKIIEQRFTAEELSGDKKLCSADLVEHAKAVIRSLDNFCGDLVKKRGGGWTSAIRDTDNLWRCIRRRLTKRGIHLPQVIYDKYKVFGLCLGEQIMDVVPVESVEKPADPLPAEEPAV